MKGLAEFLTIFGMFLGLKIATRFRLHVSFCFGIATRAFIMMLVNLALIYMGIISITLSYSEITLILVLLTGFF
jgi:hypothetical protein